MNKTRNATATDDAPVATDEQIKAIVQKLFADGAIEIDIDDSDIRKAINKVAQEANEFRNRVSQQIGEIKAGGVEQVTAKLADIQKGVEASLMALDKNLAAAAEKAASERINSVAKFDEAKLRAVADEVFQSGFASKMAKQAENGETVPLPPLLKVDPFFVENAQTKRIELALQSKRHLMISGPSGSGKTFPVEQVLRKHGKRYLKVSVADGLALSDFLCRANVRSTKLGTETYFSYGFLPFAMKHGLVLILDEIDQCQPEVVSVLNAALEFRTLYIPQTGETIIAKDGWQVFMTCNTLRDTTGNYAGFRLNAALLNRVTFGKGDYLQAPEEISILNRVGLTKKDAQVIVGLFKGLRAAYDAGKLTQAPSTRLAVRIARCLLGQDDDGNKCMDPMPLNDAFAFCFLDGLPENEVKEAQAILTSGI